MTGRFRAGFIGFGLIGIGTVACWGSLARLEDLRKELGIFYALWGLAFGLYLLALRMVGRWERQAQPESRSRLLFGWLFLTAVAARLVLLGTAPTFSDDVYRYRWDGRVQSVGVDPYRYPPNAPELAFLRDEQDHQINFPHLRTVYPPLTQLAFRLGAWLGGTIFVHKTLFVASELLTVLGLYLLLRQRTLSFLWLAAYLWHPLVILEIAGSGHNDALGAGWLWLAVAALCGRRWWSAALAASAAFLSKFVSLILVPWWFLRREGRKGLGLFLGLSLLALAFYPTAVPALVESFSKMVSRVGSHASVVAVLTGVTGSLLAARLLALGGLAGFLLWWSRRCDDPAHYVGGALAVAALLAPALHPWYLVWLVPCFCFWRPSWLMALTATAVVSYSVWPGRQWIQYAPVLGFGIWEVGRWMYRSSFRLAMKPAPLARS